MSFTYRAYFLITARGAFRDTARAASDEEVADMLCGPALWSCANWCLGRSDDELKIAFLERFAWEFGADDLAGIVQHILADGATPQAFDRWWSLVEVDEVRDLDAVRADMAANRLLREKERAQAEKLRQMFADGCTMQALLEHARDLVPRKYVASAKAIALLGDVFDVPRTELTAIFDQWSGFGGRDPGLKADEIERRHGASLRARLRQRVPGESEGSQ